MWRKHDIVCAFTVLYQNFQKVGGQESYRVIKFPKWVWIWFEFTYRFYSVLLQKLLYLLAARYWTVILSKYIYISSIYLCLFAEFSPLQTAGQPLDAWRNVSTNNVRPDWQFTWYISQRIVRVSLISLPVIIYPRRCEDISPTSAYEI